MRGGKPVALFPRCFEALLLLIEHRGELLDKPPLVQHAADVFAQLDAELAAPQELREAS